MSLKNNDDKPIEGAKVSLAGATSAVTDNKGTAYLFIKDMAEEGSKIEVECGDKLLKFDWDKNSDNPIECKFDNVEAKANKSLDFMIVCDTTGSMGDELSYLAAELKDIVTRIKEDNGNIKTRLSVNFYRDEQDEYVVREYPFTDNLADVVNAIGEQYASGGGDFPEAVHTALDSAINRHEWNEDAVKVMFLVLDAPPHDDGQIPSEVKDLIEKAAGMGIRIVPVAASGIDKSTEYLLRHMAFLTGGTYTFLTDDSGIGFTHLEPTIGDYTVERLNDMMVRIVDSYLESY